MKHLFTLLFGLLFSVSSLWAYEPTMVNCLNDSTNLAYYEFVQVGAPILVVKNLSSPPKKVSLAIVFAPENAKSLLKEQLQASFTPEELDKIREVEVIIGFGLLQSEKTQKYLQHYLFDLTFNQGDIVKTLSMEHLAAFYVNLRENIRFTPVRDVSLPTYWESWYTFVVKDVLVD